MAVHTVETARGPARLHTDGPGRAARALVVLGHGAGGGVDAGVLVAVRDALVDVGCRVTRMEQPYRVAGRRAPDRADMLDAVAVEVITALRRQRGAGDIPLILGGKSMGARVACRTAGALGASGVVCLGFPLHPPGRPERSRADDLLSAPCDVLVLQGTRDGFGAPAEVLAAVRHDGRVSVHTIEGGDHSFAARKADGRTTAECVGEAAGVAARWVDQRISG